MLALLTGIAAGCSQRTDTGNALQVVRVSARAASMANAPLFIADEEGFFAREGIKLEFVSLSTDLTQSIPALEQEEIDVIPAQLSIGFFNAVARGARSRIVADRGHVDPRSCDFTGIVGRGSLFKSADPPAAQLRGRRFAANSATASGYLIARYLSSKGMTIADVRFVTVPDNVQLQALRDGSIDAMFSTEPRLTPSLPGNQFIAPGNKYTPGLQYGIMIFGPSLLVTHRDLGQRFINAYLRGVRQLNQGKTARNLDIIARRIQVSADTARRLCLAPVRDDGALDSPSLLEFQKWGVEQGHQIRTLSQAEVTDLEFVRKASATLDSEVAAR
jgi:ABC-type nitrate/sulfonate/bicarbonate transport system substrate-binding protein